MVRRTTSRDVVVSSRIPSRIAPHVASGNGRPWRCRTCGSLLGIERGDELHVRFKDAELWIVGRCRQVCRRCGESNSIAIAPCPESP
jgi:hypothetical protein